MQHYRAAVCRLAGVNVHWIVSISSDCPPVKDMKTVQLTSGPAANYFLTLPLARWTRLTHPSVFGLFSHGDTWTERDFKYFMNQINCGHFLPLIPAISPGQKPWRITTVPPSSALESDRTSNPACGGALTCYRIYRNYELVTQKIWLGKVKQNVFRISKVKYSSWQRYIMIGLAMPMHNCAIRILILQIIMV